MGKYEQVAQLLQNESFVDELSATSSVKEVQDVFAKRDIELSSAEVEEMMVAINATAKSGELSDEELDVVTGGGWIGSCWKALKKGWDYGVKFCDWMYDKFGIV